MSSDLSVERHSGSDRSSGVDGKQLLVVDEPIMDLTTCPKIWVCRLNTQDTHMGNKGHSERTLFFLLLALYLGTTFKLRFCYGHGQTFSVRVLLNLDISFTNSFTSFPLCLVVIIYQVTCWLSLNVLLPLPHYCI